MKDLVDYMTGKEGYRIIAGSIAIDGQEEEEKIYKFPYIRRIKRKTFSDEKAFNAMVKSWEGVRSDEELVLKTGKPFGFQSSNL